MPLAVRRGTLAAAAVAATLTGGLALGGQRAEAGTYTHFSCQKPDGSPGNGSGWSGVGTAGTSTGTSCSNTGGAVDAVFLTGGPWPGGENAEMTYSAPADTRIAAIAYRRMSNGFGNNPSQPYSGHNAWYISGLEYCAPFGGVTSECNGSYERSFGGLDVDRLSFNVNCWGSVPAPGCYAAIPGEAPHLRLSRAKLILRDTSPPRAAAALGALAQPGSHRGTESIGADVTDAGGGVYRTLVSVDGALVSSTLAEGSQGRCVDADPTNADPYEFLHARPCALDAQVSARLDTTRLTEGRHTIAVAVEDAAGNSTLIHDSNSFMVDNVPDVDSVTVRPVAPAPDTGTPPTPGGPPAPVGTAPPSTERGAGNGSAPSDAASLSAYVGTTKETARKVRFGRATTIAGRLVGPNGKPIAGATLAVMTRVEDGRARLLEAGRVTTDEDGRYTYKLAAGPTRTVRFAYRAYAGDTRFADTSDVQVRVIAKAGLRATPRKLRNGQRVTFRGAVLGGHLPSAGLSVDLQVRQGREWRTFAVARAAKAGRFSHRYRFTRTYRPTTYTFRALVRGDSRFPFLPGGSNRAKVSVR